LDFSVLQGIAIKRCGEALTTTLVDGVKQDCLIEDGKIMARHLENDDLFGEYRSPLGDERLPSRQLASAGGHVRLQSDTSGGCADRREWLQAGARGERIERKE
jgi:hypothetical protein